MLDKAQKEHPITTPEELERMLCQCTAAKDNLSRHRGYSPEIWVLRKSRHLPASVTSDDWNSSDFIESEDTPWSSQNDAVQFQENLKLREAARVASITSDHDMKLRRSFLRRARPSRCDAPVGQWVMYWRNGKGAYHGAWRGPARIITREDLNVVWISHLCRLYRCAPEHLRELSSRENQQVSTSREMTDFPNRETDRLGTGVFQYHATQAAPAQIQPMNQHQADNPPYNPNNPEINVPDITLHLRTIITNHQMSFHPVPNMTPMLAYQAPLRVSSRIPGLMPGTMESLQIGRTRRISAAMGDSCPTIRRWGPE